MRVVVLVLFYLSSIAAFSKDDVDGSDPNDNCLEVTLTGTQGGPPLVGGLAGAGTLVRYGRIANQCNDILLQFDAGRGTSERLSQVDVSPLDLDAVFITDVHSDHIEGLAGLLLYRWGYLGSPLDIVCSADVATNTDPARTLSCGGYVEHSNDAMLYSGEIAQRYAENNERHPDGPVAISRLKLVDLPLPVKPGHVVWKSDDVSVSAIATTHIAGSLAYRVDTPVGSVVIGGDASNRIRFPPRSTSTSESVEALAKDADILVHSAIHPRFAPDAGSNLPARLYYRQSNVADLGAMARRAGVRHLMLTHLIPALNTDFHGPFEIPGSPLSSEDYVQSVRESGFDGQVHVGPDLLKLRLPPKE
jgi:ribonuclease Z